jgi:Protein tyrosine and serine/threonine kinase
LYELFSRKEPYSGEDRDEVLRLVAHKSVSKRPIVPENCPAEFKSMIQECLVDGPEKRPSFEELDIRLRRIDVESVEKAIPAPDHTKGTVSLFDIFPRHIAEALSEGRKVEAEHKDIVTICFSDIVGFTTLSATLSPQKGPLIRAINCKVFVCLFGLRNLCLHFFNSCGHAGSIVS